MPSRKTRKQLAEIFQLSETQIYKWFWQTIHDTKDDLAPLLMSIAGSIELFKIFRKKLTKEEVERFTLKGAFQSGVEVSFAEMLSSVK